MEVNVTRNYSVYQNAVTSGKLAEKNISAPALGEKRIRSDEICISSDGVRKKEAADFASALHKSMEEGAGAARIENLKKQVEDGTYHVSAEVIAKRLMSGH